MSRLTLRSTSVLVLAAVSGCTGEQPAPPPPAPPEVTVAVPERRDVQTYAEFTGRTQALEEVEIRARVRGFLEETHYTPSANVRPGDLLFTIEDEPYIALRDQAAADVRNWESELARANADLQRLEMAVQSNAVSLQEVDAARALRDQADAALMSARARLDQAELDLSYTRITTPIAGRVNRWFVDPGNLVGSGDNTLLTTVVRMDPIHAYFEVSESLFLAMLAAAVEEGRTDPDRTPEPGEVPIFLGLGDDEGWPFEGWVDYVDSSVDPSTGTIQARAQFPNPEGSLFPGLFARLRIPVRTVPDAVLVAESAIGTDLGGKFVFVVDNDNVVELRRVTLGALEGTMRVISDGLSHAERYIIIGTQRARPGLPVTPTQGN